MIPNGLQSGPSSCALSSRPVKYRRQGAWVHGPATCEGRRTGRLCVVCERAARAGAPRWRGTSRPCVCVNSDLPRKLISRRTAPYVQDPWQELPNSDPTRKVIVTSHARSKDEHRDPSGESLVELPDPARGSPANRGIHLGHRRVGRWPRRGCCRYGPPAQGIVTPSASNRDLLRKVIVTRCARNSDPARKIIVTSRARNSDPTRKGAAKTSCKGACFLGSDSASLLCVCMFYVPDVYRKGGGGWG